MFKALEPTMKAEASTRRAVEKCISGLPTRLAFDGFDCLMIWKADVEMLAELNRLEGISFYT